VVAKWWCIMASIRLENVPEDLLERLRNRARQERRSLSQEALHLLDRALTSPPESSERLLDRHVEAQLEAWKELAGHWASELTVEEEIAGIYAARSPGRQVT
jgi:plasmid stability protein